MAFHPALCLALLCVSVLPMLCVSKHYPVPIPKGGRRDVHGWLVLPMDQPTPVNGSAPGLKAWFSHHVPEFFTDSPHNFQIILKGTLYPTSSVEGELYALDIPVPPQANLLSLEYSFTPPSPFSLNDLLSGSLVDLNGIYFIGSFDTSFERIPQSLAHLHIEHLTTATYLRENETDAFTNLRYLSYPRGDASSTHFYFAHEVRQQPDFDHVVHVTVDECSGGFGAEKHIYMPGASWEVVGLPNTLDNKLTPQKTYQITLVTASSLQPAIKCTLNVLEFIHCMIGPGFSENCY